MFAPSTNTLLAINSTLQFWKITIWVNCAKEDWFVLKLNRVCWNAWNKGENILYQAIILNTLITSISAMLHIFSHTSKCAICSRVALTFKEKKQNHFNNTIYLFNEPVQNKKKTQYHHFELQHSVKSVGIFQSLWCNRVGIYWLICLFCMLYTPCQK